jgi:hypothetical protein
MSDKETLVVVGLKIIMITVLKKTYLYKIHAETLPDC